MILVYTAAAAGIGALTSIYALSWYEHDRALAEKREQTLTKANDRADSIHSQMMTAEERRRRQALRMISASARIGEIASRGDSIRYRLENDRREHGLEAFMAKFKEHEKSVEDWRSEASRVLETELPGFNLGANFDVIDGGHRIGRGDVFLITHLLRCIDNLRSVQQAVPGYVAQITE